MSVRMSKETKEVLDTLHGLGIKFNIVTPVDHRFELHYSYRRFDGREGVHFVAEIDGYGNIVECGPYLMEEKPILARIFDADGNEVKGGAVLA